ncbi:MAG TPA: tetratricopeptide repeat protein [Thiobacillus sp.]
MKTRHLAWGVALGLAMNGSAQAALDTTPDEIAVLPAYCDAKMGRRTPESVSFWQEKMGHANWIHIHHYCGGLIELNRYYRSSTGRKKANLHNAVNEFTGMVNAFTPDFFLLPEAYLNRGKAHKFMGRDAEAVNDFLKAIEINPRLAPASLELADLYVKSGKKGEALAVLRKGLEQSPSTKSLRRRYQELGGDLSAIPETTAPATPRPVASEQPASQAASAPPQAAEPDTAPVTQQKIGNKTNPWCRFCPDGPAEAAKPKAN